MSENEKRFRDVYAVKLAEAIERYRDNPDMGYAYDASGIPLVVEKMIPALRDGKANLGPAVKATAWKREVWS